MSNQEPEYIPIRDWCKKVFGVIPGQNTLCCYVKTKQIYPEPVKFAGRLMCHRNAKFIGIKKDTETHSNNPLVKRILNGSSSSQVQETRT